MAKWLEFDEGGRNGMLDDIKLSGRSALIGRFREADTATAKIAQDADFVFAFAFVVLSLLRNSVDLASLSGDTTRNMMITRAKARPCS